MIRPARFTDQKALEGLIRRQHAGSKYAPHVGISDKALDQHLAGLLAAQNQFSVGATHVSVAVRDEKVVGFIAGVLQRVYFIGDKLEAGDVFFVNEGAVGDTLGLVDAYLAWALGNRKLYEVKLSWVNTIPGAERLGALFERKGLRKIGEVWSKTAQVGDK